MKMRILKAAALMAMVALAGGCDSDDEGKKWPEHGYLLGFRTSTDPTADYIVYEDDLSSGSVSATGNGIEQAGWAYYAKAGDTYLALDYTNSLGTGYRFIDGDLKASGQFAFERMDVFGEGEDGNAIAIGAPWGGGSFECKIQVLNGETVTIAKSVATPIYVMDVEGERMNAWPTAVWIQGDKLYIPFYPLVGTTWETPVTDTAYVSVYSYPGLQYQTTFKDTRTGPIGYYSSQPCVLEDEDGNHYTFSSTSIATGFTQSTKPSGILKINAGETEFDEEYFFNIEDDFGYKVLGGAYVGNGKVVARVISTEIDGQLNPDDWAAFGVDIPLHNIAIIDVEEQTFTIVEDVPLHGGQYLTPFLVENGKVWASITTSTTDAFLYQIDPLTAKATKGARIEGSEVQTFFKY